LNYDYYIKIRPDIQLLEPLNFNTFLKSTINARCRQYTGPKKIQWGSSINGEGIWRNVQESFYDNEEKVVIPDDMLYIFDNNIIKLGAFDKIEHEISSPQNEWYHSTIWNSRKIPINIIGVYLKNTRYNTYSGNLNM
jgi:hypothetical protein